MWDESITLDTGSGPQELWHAAPPAKHPTRYNLSQFAIELNEMTAGLQPHLPPTDCRLRPDQAALERGKFDLVRLAVLACAVTAAGRARSDSEHSAKRSELKRVQ